MAIRDSVTRAAALTLVIGGVSAGCASSAEKVQVGSNSPQTVVDTSPEPTRYRLDASDASVTVALPLPEGSVVSPPELQVDSNVTDQAALLRQFAQWRETRAQFEADSAAHEANPALPAPTRSTTPPLPTTEVSSSRTMVSIPDLGVLTIGKLDTDLFTKELVEAEVFAVPGTSEFDVAGKPALWTSKGTGGGSICWHQAPGVTYCVAADLLEPGQGQAYDPESIKKIEAVMVDVSRSIAASDSD
jgi:hypothetical protein